MDTSSLLKYSVPEQTHVIENETTSHQLQITPNADSVVTLFLRYKGRMTRKLVLILQSWGFQHVDRPQVYLGEEYQTVQRPHPTHTNTKKVD
jgi:hypothetical protein